MSCITRGILRIIRLSRATINSTSREPKLTVSLPSITRKFKMAPKDMFLGELDTADLPKQATRQLVSIIIGDEN